jgi:acyl-coenzyme A synthetase/AMP-(fatty) acid ligase
VLRVRTVVNARLILVGDDVTGIPPTDRSFDLIWLFADLDWRADAPMPNVAITRDDIIQIIFTSGATAEPKASSSATATCWRTSSRSNARC